MLCRLHQFYPLGSAAIDNDIDLLLVKIAQRCVARAMSSRLLCCAFRPDKSCLRWHFSFKFHDLFQEASSLFNVRPFQRLVFEALVCRFIETTRSSSDVDDVVPPTGSRLERACFKTPETILVCFHLLTGWRFVSRVCGRTTTTITAVDQGEKLDHTKCLRVNEALSTIVREY